MPRVERQTRKEAREAKIRERYQNNVQRSSGDPDDLEYHRQRSGLYLFRIYRWVRFGGIVLVILLVILLFAVVRIGYDSGV